MFPCPRARRRQLKHTCGPVQGRCGAMQPASDKPARGGAKPGRAYAGTVRGAATRYRRKWPRRCGVAACYGRWARLRIGGVTAWPWSSISLGCSRSRVVAPRTCANGGSKWRGGASSSQAGSAGVVCRRLKMVPCGAVLGTAAVGVAAGERASSGGRPYAGGFGCAESQQLCGLTAMRGPRWRRAAGCTRAVPWAAPALGHGAEGSPCGNSAGP